MRSTDVLFRAFDSFFLETERCPHAQSPFLSFFFNVYFLFFIDGISLKSGLELPRKHASLKVLYYSSKIDYLMIV